MPVNTQSGKPLFDFRDLCKYHEKCAVHCRTHFEREAFFERMREIGGVRDDFPVYDLIYGCDIGTQNISPEDVAFSIFEEGYDGWCSIQWYRDRNYRIYEFSDFNWGIIMPSDYEEEEENDISEDELMSFLFEGDNV